MGPNADGVSPSPRPRRAGFVVLLTVISQNEADEQRQMHGMSVVASRWLLNRLFPACFGGSSRRRCNRFFPLPTLRLHDSEALSAYRLQRLTHEAIALPSHEQRIERSLQDSDREVRAAHVFKHDETAMDREAPFGSAGASRSSGIVQSARVMTTLSNVSSGKSSAWASPTASVTSRPSAPGASRLLLPASSE